MPQSGRSLPRGAGMATRMRHCLLALVAAAWAQVVGADARMPLVDIHTHYKVSQEGVTSPQAAIDRLRAQNVDWAVVIGSPPEYALRLEALDPARIVPIYGPYNGVRNWFRWAHDPGLVEDARVALASGDYQGIGELHLISGYAPQRRDAQVVDGLMRLGAEFGKPVLLHTEFSRPDPLLDLCRAHPDTPVLWAHAGAVLKPRDVREVMEACPNVSAELSARDPWRFVVMPIADQTGGRLLPEWERLVLDYADRFLVGSDPVWPVERLDAWDQDDTGWDELGRFLDFHRRWLSYLPEGPRNRIARLNAYRLFGLAPPAR